MICNQGAQVDLTLLTRDVVNLLLALEHNVEQAIVVQSFMDEESHDEAQNVRQQLHALVIGQLKWLRYLSNDVRQVVPHLLLVHQLQQIALLFNLDRLRV